MGKRCNNFMDVCRVMSEWHFSLRYDYYERISRGHVLVFENDYNNGIPISFQHVIGNKFNVTTSKDKFVVVTRVKQKRA